MLLQVQSGVSGQLVLPELFTWMFFLQCGIGTGFVMGACAVIVLLYLRSQAREKRP